MKIFFSCNTYKHLLATAGCLSVTALSAQQPTDTLKSKTLDSITIIASFRQGMMQTMSSIHGTYMYGAKKTEVINLEKLDVNRTDNNPRQLFAKVPGVFVYENDGTGNQVNIATRGLTAHRSWEMNVRHNDVMTNSDLYGYPASHFNAPTESIERIEIVRGSGALQYGAQFGGMVNYITKEADSSRKFSFETQNAAGSYGLLSTYNAVGGKTEKLQYYAYMNYRRSNGYRESSEYHYLAGHAHLSYAFSRKLKLRTEYNYMDYQNHVNGGLTDAQFKENPRQATRKRNYYSPTIHVPSLRLDYDINKNTSINFISSAILGSRNSVQFIALSTVKDTFNTNLGSYNPRQVDIDQYHSYSQELRVRHQYSLFAKPSTVVAGIRYINNDLHRMQLGKGTTGSDYDLTLTDPQWGRDLHFKTQNVSVFAENMTQLGKRWLFTAGVRYENGETRMSGNIKNYTAGEIPVNIPHRFALVGAGLQYEAGSNISLFANWAQAYRPVIFADIIPTTNLNKIDHNIKDATGNNAEIGVRGRVNQYLHFDVSLFNMVYRNRTGNLALVENNQTYLYRTNIGNALSQGAEVYVEWQPLAWLSGYRSQIQLSLFTSTAFIHAGYTKGQVAVNGANVDVKGNWIETTPGWISRNGLQLGYKGFSSTIQYSITGKSYADALNTVTPNASGTIGLVPGYQLVDWNFTWRFAQHYNVKLAFNNLFNKQYFTERPPFFPGPGGLYPSDGRSVICSIGARL
ncbi:TonB-dependent receptor [Paraflavitalea sp. CAU 1676]|uniref:TonB-dependent receptor family protein n=1 Tax=Paraflavitalea sp. CAU 1676 TaxID=3032598 RepID=UPI0023DB09AB|nr:TonB-dependent receptor [Paraflavitalea sp. CAU 1676]MDF2187011.1 TonB-dependent receptor [Paraflavitalea sp. CAU 1676]